MSCCRLVCGFTPINASRSVMIIYTKRLSIFLTRPNHWPAMAGHCQQAFCSMKLLGPNPMRPAMAGHGVWAIAVGQQLLAAAMAGHGRQARCLMKLPGPNPIWPAMAGAGSSRVGSSHVGSSHVGSIHVGSRHFCNFACPSAMKQMSTPKAHCGTCARQDVTLNVKANQHLCLV